MAYLMHWGHAYLIHFGFWMTFLFGVTFYKEGLQEYKLEDFPRQLALAILVSAILGIFSSHSHHLLMGLMK